MTTKFVLGALKTLGGGGGGLNTIEPKYCQFV